MRRGTCPKCAGTSIGHLEHVLDNRSGNPLDMRQKTEHRVLGGVVDKKGWISDDVTVAEVEAYVCTTCGYFEEYVKAPTSLPWERMPHFRWLDKGSDGTSG